MVRRKLSVNAACSLSGIAALCLVAGTPAEAEACSPPPQDGLDVALLAGGEAVHRDGAIVMHVSDFDGDASDVGSEITVTVVLEGLEVPGSLEVLDVLGGPSVWEHRVIVLWRPDAEMAAADEYALSIAYENGWDEDEQVIEETFSVIDEAAPALEAITASVDDDVTTGLTAQDFGDRICCTQDDSCGGYTECVTENRRESLSIRGDYDLGNAGAQYTLIRPFSGLSGAAEEPTWWLLPGEELVEGFQPSFNEPFGSYCVAFEAIDLLGGASIMSDVACLDAPEDLVLAEESFDVQEWTGSCLGEPYWEESGEPWQPGSGSGTAGESDTDGGSDSDSNGGLDSHSGSGSGSDSESGSDTDGGAGQDGSGGGCSVGGSARASPWALLGFLGFGGFLFRRRS